MFLPGWQAIADVYEALQQRPRLAGLAGAVLQLHVLHSLVPVSEQQEVFQPAPAGGGGGQRSGKCIGQWRLMLSITGNSWSLLTVC